MRVAIITARGGSQRIPKKNIRPFFGKPIIAYSIEAAKASNFDVIVVSTDDDEIRDIAWEHGAKHLEREPAFARNEIGTHEVMGRCCEQMGLKDTDQVCCIYPTAPMISPSDIEWGSTMLWLRPCYFVVSIGIAPLCDAGQFYWSLAGHWKDTAIPICGLRTGFYPVETDRVCDINVEQDWQRAEELYAALQRRAAQ